MDAKARRGTYGSPLPACLLGNTPPYRGVTSPAIQPQESYSLDLGVGHYYQTGEEIVCVAAVIDFVAYVNNTAEATNGEALQKAMDDSRQAAEGERQLVLAASDVLKAKVAHPVATLVKNLDEQHYRVLIDVATQLQYSAPTNEEAKLKALSSSIDN